MAKPATLPRWANTTAVNITDPPSGLKDVGYVTGNKPAAQHHNWLFNLIYLWLVYLDALLGGAGVSETLVFGAATISGAATVGTTLGVTGLATFTVAPTAPSYKYTTIRKRTIPAIGGRGAKGAGFWDEPLLYGVITTASTPGEFAIPLTSETGERVGSIDVLLSQASGFSGGAVNFIRGNGTVVATAAIANTTGDQTVTVTANHTIVDGEYYEIEVAFANGATTRVIKKATLDITRP